MGRGQGRFVVRFRMIFARPLHSQRGIDEQSKTDDKSKGSDKPKDKGHSNNSKK